jgi:four helix bundle protein
MIKDKKPEDIGLRVFRLVTNTLHLLKAFPKDQINTILIGQLIRCITSIGANIEEARGGHTKNDFSHSMNIAKKEALEARYWLKLLSEMNNAYKKEITNLVLELEEIIRILVTIVKTSNTRKFS